ncbi:hypothetical protein BKA70DRAFT_53648 [Coprinopsis sp. MPI-PUGE-AT-0042]|nr:hypothetical protein BKA70DRAFT_53648 [Coprinopsis sp. MPI-PUGE-AT-0042]
MPSAPIASVAKAAFNRIFHPTTSASKMSTQTASDSPISPAYSDAGSGFSAPSPSPFSSASTSTSATSYSKATMGNSSDYNTPIYDLASSEQHQTATTAAADTNPAVVFSSPTDLLSGHAVNPDYPVFAPMNHSSGNPADYPSGADVEFNGAVHADTSAQNDCNHYISWSPKSSQPNLASDSSSNGYQQSAQRVGDGPSSPAGDRSTGGSTGANSAQPVSFTVASHTGPFTPTGLLNLDLSNGPAKPSMLGPLYIPQSHPSSMPMSASSASSGALIHSPVPNRYSDPSVVSGGQPQPTGSYAQGMPSHYHHQRHPSGGSTGSNGGGHPVLFDVDLDEWSAQNAAHSQHMRYPSSGSTSSVSPPEMYRQPIQQPYPRSYPHAMPASHRGHALNLNFNPPQTASPASSLSSLSPGQMSLPPLTPGHEFGPGFGGDYGIVLNGADGLGLAINGPPTTPLSSTSLTISPVIPGPSSYPGVPSNGGRGANNSQVLLSQRRASLGLAQPSMSANTGPMATRQHPHPYAQGYQQRSANGRPSSLHLQHQMQQARRSPLHQEFQEAGVPRVGPVNAGSIPEDGEYAAMYEKMYRERKRREMKQPGGRGQPAGSFNPGLTSQRRHSAPLLEMQLQGDGFHNFQHSPVFMGEMGRRPSAPVVQMHQHQQQVFNNPNNGGYAPGLPPSPSSLSSSRSVPPAPSLSTSSSSSSNASRSPAAVASNQILSPQQSRHIHRHSALDAQHDNRLLSEMMNSGSMNCMPGSVYDEDGGGIFSEGVGIPSMMQLEIDEKVSQQLQQQPSFDMGMGGGMDLMDVDGNPTHIGMDMDIFSNMEMTMVNSVLQDHHVSDPASTNPPGTGVYIAPMPVTVDMNELTGGAGTNNVNANLGISPRMMLDEGSPSKAGETKDKAYGFESGLDRPLSPTLLGGGSIAVQDWQKAGVEYDSADSSDSDGEGASGLLSDAEVANKKVGAEGREKKEARKGLSSTRHRAKSDAVGGLGEVVKKGSVMKPTMRQRASTRTITPRTTRNKASTQTLTPATVQFERSAGYSDDLGEEDADGEDDLDEDAEDAEAGEDNEFTISSSDDEDYDDDKDGEFVLRSRSRSKGAAVSRSNSKRGNSSSAPSASAPAGRPRASGGRSLRSRGANNGRYNPYSLYAAAVTAQTNEGASITSSSASRSLASANGSGSDGSRSSSVDDGESESISGKGKKPRPTASLPVPVPVPNLTKKSRGRRVPTVSSLEDLKKTAASQNATASGSGRKARNSGAGGGGAKGTRMYLCDVEGCGKCFARGEHLKRHVRSIHTNEKPHTCPYPGCGKEFSRHDNLGQHMRVHKDYVPPANTIKA